MENGTPHNVIGYLHDCLQADRRETTLWNLFDRKLGRIIVTSEQE